MSTNTSSTTRPTLKKEIGTWGFFCLAFGSIIGVGWVTAMGSWLGEAGPLGAMIAFLIGGLLMLLIGLCYAEVTSMLPVAGGEVAYAYKAFGISKSFIVGWLLAFGYLAVSAFEAISIGKVLSYMFPQINIWPVYQLGGDTVYGMHLLLSFIFTALITYINFKGVKQAIKFQIILTIGFIALTFLFIVAGFVKGDIKNIQPLFASSHTSGIVAGIVGVLVTIPFWFVGFDTIPQSAEEAQVGTKPKTLGILMLSSIGVATLFYIVLLFSTSLAGSWQTIIGSELPTAAAFEYVFDSPILVNLILTAALIGLFTSWNGFFLAGSRVLFALGRGKIISEKFGQVHKKFGTPHYAILFSGAITLIGSFLGRGAMLAFVNVGSFCIVAAFLGVSLSLVKMRKRFPEMARPFKLPGGLFTGYLAVFGSVLILGVMIWPWSPVFLHWPLEWLILSGCCLLGAIFWFSSKTQRKKITEKERGYLILEKYSNP